jgi:CBS domain-containing protein
MSYTVVTLSPETRMKEVYTILREKGHMGIPVLDVCRLVGMISRRDFGKTKKVDIKCPGEGVYDYESNYDKTRR